MRAVRALGISACVYHVAAAPTSALDSAAGARFGRLRICSYQRRPSAACQRISQKNTRRHAMSAASVERDCSMQPRQHDAIALEIVTHAVEPFDLRGAHRPFHRTCGFTRAVARQSLERVFALAGCRELESRVRPHGFQHSDTADATPPTRRPAAQGSCRSGRPPRRARRRCRSKCRRGRRGPPRPPRSETSPAAHRGGGTPAARSVEQQLIAPGDGRRHRLLAFGKIPWRDRRTAARPA